MKNMKMVTEDYFKNRMNIFCKIIRHRENTKSFKKLRITLHMGKTQLTSLIISRYMGCLRREMALSFKSTIILPRINLSGNSTTKLSASISTTFWKSLLTFRMSHLLAQKTFQSRLMKLSIAYKSDQIPKKYHTRHLNIVLALIRPVMLQLKHLSPLYITIWYKCNIIITQY